jgi:biotin synthase
VAATSHWPLEAVAALFELPFNDLIYRAHGVHRAHHPANDVQLSTLLSIKTGGCPEDCAYCPQAARYHTGVTNDAMLSVADVAAAAQAAKDAVRRIAISRRCSTWCEK